VRFGGGDCKEDTFFISIAGWILVAAFASMIAAPVVPWLLVAFSLVLTASGVLAISVGRTFMSRSATGDLGLADPHEPPGDALELPAVFPGWTRATTPYAILGVGLVLLALSGWWALRGMP
jgi:hypothetical protein